MLQNITLLNSVQNNAGLALDVQGADHRTNLRVEVTREVRAEQLGYSGKRPCDGAPVTGSAGGCSATETLRGSTGTVADARIATDAARARFGAIAAATQSAASAASAASAVAAASAPAAGEQSLRAASERSGDSTRPLYPQQHCLKRKPAMPRGSKMPAAIWASLVLSRV